MELALMIEGQEGVTWEQWVALAGACEAHGISTLFRSDHYMTLDARANRGSLDAWGTICALAAVTSTLRLGTMVSPATFRHPSELARLVTTADLVSGGRVELGLGAGWHEREHAAHGFPFYASNRERMDLMEEQAQIVLGAWGPGPFSFTGHHYTLEDLDALPKPAQRPHPPLLMGGLGGPRGAKLAALYADEYNTVFPTPDEARQRAANLAAAAEQLGRTRPLPLSVMTPVVLGADQADLDQRVAQIAEGQGVSAEAFLAGANPGWIVGTLDAVVEQFQALADAGVSRVMCQHLAHWDLEYVELLGRELAPRLR
jgi:alkanesulfonate monooxygenase SsuD/methylene tetrahydromethanopterin reductase-like flavin-dependent oxidoreductase (luciferase family)